MCFARCGDCRTADARALVGRLALACETPLEQVPLLDEVIARATGRPCRWTLAKSRGQGPVGAEAEAAPIAAVATAVAEPPAVEPNNAVKTQAISDEGTLPQSAFEEVAPLPRRVLSSFFRTCVSPVRALDRLFCPSWGQDNTILHGFLRVVVVAALVAGVLLGLSIGRNVPASVGGSGQAIGGCASSRSNGCPEGKGRSRSGKEEGGRKGCPKKIEEKAARKKIEEEAARKKIEEEAARKEKAEEDEAKKKAEEEAHGRKSRRTARRALILAAG